jgi:hypothetical protein
VSVVVERKPKVLLRVVKYLVRSYPYCPYCDLKMNRDNPSKTDPLLAGYECPNPKCKFRHKTRDRVE